MEQRELDIRENEKVLTVMDWIKIMILMAIPLLNIIMWIKWLVSEKTNKNLKNFLIATLVLIFIFSILYFILFAIVFSGVGALNN